MTSEPVAPPLPQADTAPEVEALLVAGYRRMTPAEKLRQLGGMRETAIRLAVAGIRARHGDVGAAEMRRRLASLLLGEELAEAAYGPLRPGAC